jgi:hypothetical protein
MTQIVKLRSNFSLRPIPKKGPFNTDDYNSMMEESSVDLAGIASNWNLYVYPVLNGLPRGDGETRWVGATTVPDPLVDGLDGDNMFVDNAATASTNDGLLWESVLLRPSTVKEILLDLHDKVDTAIQDLEEQISQTPVNLEFSQIRTFIGKDSEGNNSPSYSSSNYISNGNNLETAIGTLDTSLDTHESLVDNPHSVTTTQIGAAVRLEHHFTAHSLVDVPIIWTHNQGTKWPMIQVVDRDIANDYGTLADEVNTYEAEHGLLNSDAFVSVEYISLNEVHVYTNITDGLIIGIF